jgi:hypothetical protein
MAKIFRQKMCITFEDLPLLEAVRKLFDDPEFVRTESLLIEEQGREWVLQKIIANLPTACLGKYRFEKILLSVNQFRKLNREHLKKRLIILEHARKMTVAECFYKGKVSTECSNEVDLDRIKPGKRSGEYTVQNTVLSCSKHNRQRGCKEVVNYWNQ